MAAQGIHISLSAEPIAYLGNFPVTNSMLTSVVISSLMIGFAVAANRALKQNGKPTGIQNVAEMIVESFYSFCYMITNDMNKAKKFLPFIATFFLFIILNNWSGLVPGVGTIFVPAPEHTSAAVVDTAHAVEAQPSSDEQLSGEEGAALQLNETAITDEIHAEPEEGHATSVPLFRAATADLNNTIALGLISIALVQFFGFRYLGIKYAQKYINFSSPIMFIVGLLELVSEFAKIISFAFRLFGNVFAGEVLIGVIMYLTSVVIPLPFYGLEVFVGMMQALVFSMLTLVFLNMATVGHDEH